MDTLPDPDTFYQAWTRRLMNDKTDTLDAIAREIAELAVVNAAEFPEAAKKLAEFHDRIAALSNQGEGHSATGRVNGYLLSQRAVEVICDGDIPEWMTAKPGLRVYLSQHAAEADRRDAERWRALVGSARVRVLGSAGLRSDIDPNGRPYDGYAHIGLELWTKHEAGNSPDDAADWLTKYADIAATQEQT